MHNSHSWKDAVNLIKTEINDQHGLMTKRH